MHKYRVTGRWPDQSRLVLQCAAGRYHLIRALKMLPGDGDILVGNKPHLGFGMLICPASDAIYRVIFESINQAHMEFSCDVARPAHAPTLAQRTAGGEATGADD